MKKFYFSLAIICFLSIIVFGHFKPGSIDAEQRLALTKSLIFDHTVITREYGPVRYAPLQPILMIPFYYTGYWIGKTMGLDGDNAYRKANVYTAWLFIPLITVFICLIYCNTLLQLNIPVKLVLFSTFLLLFGTLLFPYTRVMFSEPINALLILTIASILIPNGKTLSNIKIIILFLCIGLLCMNNIIFLPFFLAIPVYLAYQYRYGKIQSHFSIKSVIFYGLFFLLMILIIWFNYNYSRHGNILLFGYKKEGFTNPLFIGLYGLLFSIGRGALFYAPLTVFVVLYYILFPHQMESEIRHFFGLCVSAFIFFLILYSKWHDFDGGLCWGPRFLLPMIPVLHLMFPYVYRSDYIRKIFVRLFIFAALFINAYEYMGDSIKFEYLTYMTGQVPNRYCVFLPQYSALMNSWSLRLFVKRIPLYILVCSLSYYFMVNYLPRKYKSMIK